MQDRRNTMSIDMASLVALATFVLGWIGNEAYQYYKDWRDKRWKRS